MRTKDRTPRSPSKRNREGSEVRRIKPKPKHRTKSTHGLQLGEEFLLAPCAWYCAWVGASKNAPLAAGLSEACYLFRFIWLNSIARMMAATMATTRAVIISDNSEIGMWAAVRKSMASKMMRD